MTDILRIQSGDGENLSKLEVIQGALSANASLTVLPSEVTPVFVKDSIPMLRPRGSDPSALSAEVRIVSPQHFIGRADSVGKAAQELEREREVIRFRAAPKEPINDTDVLNQILRDLIPGLRPDAISEFQSKEGLLIPSGAVMYREVIGRLLTPQLVEITKETALARKGSWWVATESELVRDIWVNLYPSVEMAQTTHAGGYRFSAAQREALGN